MNLEKNMRNIFGHAIFAAAVREHALCLKFISLAIDTEIWYLLLYMYVEILFN